MLLNPLNDLPWKSEQKVSDRAESFLATCLKITSVLVSYPGTRPQRLALPSIFLKLLLITATAIKTDKDILPESSKESEHHIVRGMFGLILVFREDLLPDREPNDPKISAEKPYRE